MRLYVVVKMMMMMLVHATFAQSRPYSQCGRPHDPACPGGYVCKRVNLWYSQCVPSASNTLYRQCGGLSNCASQVCRDGPWEPAVCRVGTVCTRSSKWYYQCLPKDANNKHKPKPSPSPIPDPKPKPKPKPKSEPTVIIVPRPPQNNTTSPSSSSSLLYMYTRLSHGASGSAQTTRYSDCCKPSCGWQGKAIAISAPVATCASDGRTRVPVGAQSGCVGGPAYACLNQQPWAINGTFALGFAAAKFSSEGEADWCCACYLVEFKDGSAKGKRMILQVTNTGGDLGDHHFDIQLPGGGQGIFSGCSRQFPAVSPAAWGAQYGGVSSASECSRLPAQLQAGCRLRFDWGHGFDNPRVDFFRVACPAALVERTGCRRHDADE